MAVIALSVHGERRRMVGSIHSEIYLVGETWQVSIDGDPWENRTIWYPVTQQSKVAN